MRNHKQKFVVCIPFTKMYSKSTHNLKDTKIAELFIIFEVCEIFFSEISVLCLTVIVLSESMVDKYLNKH